MTYQEYGMLAITLFLFAILTVFLVVPYEWWKKKKGESEGIEDIFAGGMIMVCAVGFFLFGLDALDKHETLSGNYMVQKVIDDYRQRISNGEELSEDDLKSDFRLIGLTEDKLKSIEFPERALVYGDMFEINVEYISPKKTILTTFLNVVSIGKNTMYYKTKSVVMSYNSNN